MVDRLIKISSKSEVSETMGEMFYWLIEYVGELYMSKVGWEIVFKESTESCLLF